MDIRTVTLGELCVADSSMGLRRSIRSAPPRAAEGLEDPSAGGNELDDADQRAG
jgi:hypothetical protein